MAYASTTEVSVNRSKDQLEHMLRKTGAAGFLTAWDETGDTIEFLWKGMRIRFSLPKTDPKKFERDRRGIRRRPTSITQHMEQADRQRWRALYLVVKVKIEAVESGIAIFEEEFLSFIVDPTSNMTVGQVLVPRLREAGGRLLLTAGTGTGTGT